MSDRRRFAAGMSRVNDDTLMTSTDTSRFTDAKNGTIWDPRADMDDDGDVDANDQTLYDAKQPDWASALDATAVVAQAFSDADNPFMFQGVPHFAIETQSNATEDKLSLNHHRARFTDCPTGRWTTRDPLFYDKSGLSPHLVAAKRFSSEPNILFEYLGSNSPRLVDSLGLSIERPGQCKVIAGLSFRSGWDSVCVGDSGPTNDQKNNVNNNAQADLEQQGELGMCVSDTLCPCRRGCMSYTDSRTTEHLGPDFMCLLIDPGTPNRYRVIITETLICRCSFF